MGKEFAGQLKKIEIGWAGSSEVGNGAPLLQNGTPDVTKELHLQ